MGRIMHQLVHPVIGIGCNRGNDAKLELPASKPIEQDERKDRSQNNKNSDRKFLPNRGMQFRLLVSKDMALSVFRAIVAVVMMTSVTSCEPTEVWHFLVALLVHRLAMKPPFEEGPQGDEG